jgi:hypothetical protein
MNRIFLILIIAAFHACSLKSNNNDAAIRFSKEKHDFGIIPYEKEVVCTFDFYNTGKSLLVVYDVKPSCGCTVAEWTSDPIRPGGKGELKLKYDAAFTGVFHKTVEFYYNGPNSPIKLEIQGEVESPKGRDF